MNLSGAHAVSVCIHECSVSTNDNERTVTVSTDGGRLCRPYIIVDEQSGRPLVTAEHLDQLQQRVSEHDARTR